MKESIFQSEIRESIKFFYPQAHYKKIPDPSVHDINKTVRRPYDAYYVYDNTFIAFEYKQMKKPEAFPFDHVQDHQAYNLMNVSQGFNYGLLLINYRFNLSDKQRVKYFATQNKYNFTLVFGIKEFLELKALYLNYLKKKSIPFEYLWDFYNMKSDCVMTWDKINDKYIWNIKKIIDNLKKSERG